MSATETTRSHQVNIMKKPIAKVAFVLCLVSLGCVLVGQATDYWLAKQSFHQGLWRYCRYLIHTDGDWDCMSMDKRADYESWILDIQILEIASAISLIGCLVGLFLYWKQEDMGYRAIHIIIALVGTVLAGLLCLAGVTMALVCAVFVACEIRKGLAVDRYRGYENIPGSGDE